MFNDHQANDKRNEARSRKGDAGTAVVRNRMPGGVGGRLEQSSLLPDLARKYMLEPR